MPALITLEEAKAHSRIDTDDEDTAIQAMVTAAIAYVAHALNRGELDSTASPMAKQAALLVFGDFYENREAQADRPLSKNKTVESLIDMARNYEGFVQ